MCTDDDVGKHGLLENLLDIDEDDLDEDSSHGQVFFPIFYERLSSLVCKYG